MKLRRGMRPIQVLPLGFLIIILLGALLLTTPHASTSGVRMPFTDALFTATSASCVTGLIVADTATFFSPFGQTVLLVLIQLGGLGFMTMSTILFSLTGRRISLHERMSMAEGLGEDRLQGIVRLCRSVLSVTAVCELCGALLLSLRFVPQFGLAKGIWISVFTSISAFCNAGFDLMGNYASLTAYTHDAYVLCVVAALIAVGGLGFGVVLAIVHKRRFSRLRLHAKFVVVGTVGLIAFGTLAFLLLEYDNPATLAPMPFGDKMLNAMFQSVTLRTAGFNSIDQLALRDASKGVGILLMLFGGAPSGTAGGLKITTMFTLALSVRAYIRGDGDVSAFGRTIPRDQVRRAMTLFFCGVSYLVLMTIFISAIEQGYGAGAYGIWNQLYEATSALCTVGVSVGVSGAASTATRMILASMMYVGRVGLLTIAMSLSDDNRKDVLIRYPEESIMIG